jgi:hypothetical protein
VFDSRHVSVWKIMSSQACSKTKKRTPSFMLINTVMQETNTFIIKNSVDHVVRTVQWEDKRNTVVYVAKGNQLFGRPSQQIFGIKELWAKNNGGSTMGDKLLVVTNKVFQ